MDRVAHQRARPRQARDSSRSRRRTARPAPRDSGQGRQPYARRGQQQRHAEEARLPPQRRAREPDPEFAAGEDHPGYGYKDPRGVAWCESGNGRRMCFVDGDAVSSELLGIAKSACGSLAYWVKDLASGVELDPATDGGWPPELVPSGHCDEVTLPAEAGPDLEGLSAAAIGRNKKTRGQTLALSVLLAAAHDLNISDDALYECHPDLVALNDASHQAYGALDNGD